LQRFIQSHPINMLRCYAFKAGIHEAHQMQSSKLPIWNAAEFVFFIRRCVVESVPAKGCDFKSDATNLFRRHRIEALECVKEVKDRRWMLFSEKSGMRRAICRCSFDDLML